MQLPRSPLKVGVAAGTTTFVLRGPTATTMTATPCDQDPARVALQQRRLWPAGKYRTALASIADLTPTDGWSLAPRPKGAGLGLVLAPYGDRSPEPSVEMVGARLGPPATCRGCRPTRVSDYQQATTYTGLGAAYRGVGPFMAPDMPVASDGPPIIPTDTQLATQYGYTPVMSQWVPFTQGPWPAPWVPPGGPRPLAGPQAHVLGVTTGDIDAGVPLPPDTASATLQTLQSHQDRMYMLGIISAAAVASTALVNVFRYANERRDLLRRRNKAVAAEPAAVISGYRRQRSRRPRRR